MSKVVSSVFSDREFLKIWVATLVAQLGSAIAGVGYPILALQRLELPASSVAAIATVSAIFGLAVALPAGAWVEYRRKRVVLIASYATTCTSFILLAALVLSGRAGFWSLLVAMVVNMVSSMFFGSASMAHTKDLVSSEIRADAIGKIQSAIWVAMIVGPFIAGLLVAVVSIYAIFLLVGLCFLCSALLVVCIRRPEGQVPVRDVDRSRVRELFAGVDFWFHDRKLGRILVSWVLFAGAVAALTPVSQVFFLTDLSLSAFEYGLISGAPSVAALAGSWASGRLVRRFGASRVIVAGSMLRLPFYFVYPLLQPGEFVVVIVIVAVSGILFISSVVNAAISALRMELVPDHLLSRTSSAWMMATRLAGPVAIPLVGAVMTMASPRVALLAVCGLVVLSTLVLPVRDLIRPEHRV